eukprot:6528597-Pyramimonas_sp.AAC.1
MQLFVALRDVGGTSGIRNPDPRIATRSVGLCTAVKPLLSHSTTAEFLNSPPEGRVRNLSCLSALDAFWGTRPC